MKKKLILFFALTSFMLTGCAVGAAADGGITICVNEETLQCDTAPFIENGRTMVPMRKIFEALNAEVEWNGETRTVTAVKDDSEITLQVDNYTMYKNGAEETLDAAPVIVSDSTFVPVRAVSQSLNASVEWLGETQTVYINSPEAYNNALAQIGQAAQREEPTLMYAPDGRTIDVPNSEIEAYRNVGWYLEPVTLMYAPDGRTVYAPNSEVAAYQNVGWYLKPVTTMYAQDGRTVCVPMDEASDYRSVGWYDTYEEARAAASASAAASAASAGASQNSPNSGGRAVYRTPYGKRYHYDPDCGGKNSYQISMEQALNSGLTPCQKCAR